MRRKRIVGNKKRTLLEQKKQNPGSVGQKCSEQMNVSTLFLHSPYWIVENCLEHRMFLKDCPLAVNCVLQHK